MEQNKIVVRFQDGRVLKGYTNNFMPNKDVFHLIPLDAPAGSKPLDVLVKTLKAVFFVNDFTGNKEYQEKKTFDTAKPAVGRKIKVVFKDGEELIGTTQGYQPGRPGFFVFPADSQANQDRVFVYSAATRQISFI
jgi:small nuclear ribonucleoprotein (snRNP)-like protein